MKLTLLLGLALSTALSKPLTFLSDSTSNSTNSTFNTTTANNSGRFFDAEVIDLVPLNQAVQMKIDNQLLTFLLETEEYTTLVASTYCKTCTETYRFYCGHQCVIYDTKDSYKT